MGNCDANLDAFYCDIADDAGDWATWFYARGAGMIAGADAYYWMSKIIYGDDTLVVTPENLSENPVDFWMSGLARWMVPMDGRPAPHNIILGQWEPTDAESELGIQLGFGAISVLFFGSDQCGSTRNNKANSRTETYETLLNSFNAID